LTPLYRLIHHQGFYDIRQKGFGIERVIFLLFAGLTIFGYFNVRFYIASRVTIFRVFLNLRYGW
jgi:hypothetical protein